MGARVDSGTARPTAGNDIEQQYAVVALALTEIGARLESLERDVRELTRLGDRREALIDKLHEENQRLRAGEIAQAQAPIIREMIRSYDLVAEISRHDAAPHVELVGRRLLDGLAQVGVRPVAVDRSSPFDPRQHAAVGTDGCTDPAADMTVKTVVRAGFVQDGERVIRPADVRLWRYTGAPSYDRGQSP